LQEVLGVFEIIPILCDQVNPFILANMLLPYIDEGVLVIASTDLSHYHSYAKAKIWMKYAHRPFRRFFLTKCKNARPAARLRWKPLCTLPRP
jgi:AmmeMemoRadiSam system protein B